MAYNRDMDYEDDNYGSRFTRARRSGGQYGEDYDREHYGAGYGSQGGRYGNPQREYYNAPRSRNRPRYDYEDYGSQDDYRGYGSHGEGTYGMQYGRRTGGYGSQNYGGGDSARNRGNDYGHQGYAGESGGAYSYGSQSGGGSYRGYNPQSGYGYASGDRNDYGARNRYREDEYDY